MARVEMSINGRRVAREAEDRTLLANFIRDDVGLTGTHIGCDTSQCGCCTVFMNGRAVKSCSVLAAKAHGAQILTIEGLAASWSSDGELHPVQQAFTECHALQCGFCTPGMIMAVVGMLQDNPDPSDEEICHGLEGNLCRCTGYVNIIKAVKAAAAAMSK